MRADCLDSGVPVTRRERDAGDSCGDDLRGRERRTGSTRLDAIAISVVQSRIIGVEIVRVENE